MAGNAFRRMFRQTAFGDLCEHSAFGPRFGGDLYASDGNVATLRTTDISEDGRIEYGTMPLARLDLSKLTQHLLLQDDLVITRTGRVGTTAVFDDFPLPVLPGAFLIRFRLRQGVAHPYFYRHFFNSAIGRQLVASVATGSVQQNLNITSLHGLCVPAPPFCTQCDIASILGTLDEKIELNRRMNDTLEAVVSAIFKSWFVDFDPVRAKAEGRAPGLPKSLANLFPKCFEKSELGRIPKGWEVRPLREVTDALFDGPHATPPESLDGPVFLGIKNLTGTQLDLTDVRHIGEDDWLHWTRSVTPEYGDIVFSYEATLGHFALIPPGLRCCLGRRLALIRPKQSKPFRYFLFHCFVSAPFQRMLIARSVQGSTVNRVPLRDFPNYLLIWPPARLRCAFDGIAESFWAVIHRNQKESRTLAAIRDALSSKLLSGKLRATWATSPRLPTQRAVGIGNPPIHPVHAIHRPKVLTSVGLPPSGSLFCPPDCGIYNSLQVFQQDLELADRKLRMAASAGGDLRSALIGDALINAVSAFVGFGQLAVETYRNLSPRPQKVQKVKRVQLVQKFQKVPASLFQNLASADGCFRAHFGFGLSDGVTADEWRLLERCFQKRNLLAHEMGADRKVIIEPSEVSALLSVLEKLRGHLSRSLAHLADRRV